jgi:hypothetical protein
MDLREIGCEEGRWMELALDCIQWRALVLAVLNFMFLILVMSLITKSRNISII